MTYAEKRLDPRWQRKRLEILDASGWKCRKCDTETTTLHVHHRYYISGRDPWEYPAFCFECVCKKCHTHGTQPGEDFCFDQWEVLLDTMFRNERPECLDLALKFSLALDQGHSRETLRDAIELMLSDSAAVAHWTAAAKAREEALAARLNRGNDK